MDVRIDHVRKEFGRFAALDDTSLTIHDGELVALLGPSGSGKTTLLRVLAGLERPSAGRILFGDQDAASLSVQERNIGFVFQHYALFKHMTVLDNVAFGLSVCPARRRPPRAEIAARARRLLALVQIDGLDRRYPDQLSGGQRQRVALARALATDPRVLLLDEPFGALDARVRKDLRHWLRGFHDRTGHTTVFVTHDQDEALELADRVVVMNAGRVEQVADPDTLYDRPASPFVFAFIGDSSSLPATVRAGRLWVAGRALGPVPAADGPVRLFFRPHHARLADTGALVGRVVASRRQGDRRRLDVALRPDAPSDAPS
ncbi:sulfate/molybdate ABC transporter ATP-binding protein, partial [Rhodothalassium salexigens]